MERVESRGKAHLFFFFDEIFSSYTVIALNGPEWEAVEYDGAISFNKNRWGFLLFLLHLKKF